MIFNNRVALITGSASGLGKAMAKRLAQEDVKVVVADLNVDKINQVVKEIKNDGNMALGIKCNVTNAEEVKAMGEKIIETYGKLDIIINNAGITRDASFKNLTEEQWDTVMNVNLKSMFIVTQELSKYLEKNNYGRIINISSIVGITGNYGQANYTAAKAGVIGLTKTLAIELGKKNITVNAVAPGFIKTDMTNVIPDFVKDKMIERIALKRQGLPEEIASPVAFFASDEAGFISGTILNIDGAMQ